MELPAPSFTHDHDDEDEDVLDLSLVNQKTRAIHLRVHSALEEVKSPQIKRGGKKLLSFPRRLVKVFPQIIVLA